MINLADLQNVVTELNLDGFTPREQKEIIERLESIIVERVTIAIVEKLDEEHREEFYQLAEKHDSQKLTTFLKKHIPDISKLAKKEAKATVAEFNKLRE
jgi:hypothetical protein